MDFGKHTDRFRMRGKFNPILAIQTMALLLVGGLGWLRVASLQRGQVDLASQLGKMATLSRVLNGMNIFRTLHTSMLGGIADPDYIQLREARLKEYSDTLQKDLVVLVAFPSPTATSVSRGRE